MPDRKSDMPTSGRTRLHRVVEQTPDGSVPTSLEPAAEPAAVDLSEISWHSAEQEKAEEEPPSNAVQAGLPDRARASMQDTAVSMQRDMNLFLHPTAMDRALRDVQEQERQRIALYSSLHPGAVELDRIRRLTDPLVDNPPLRDQLQQDQQLQRLRDAAMGGSAARAIREHMDVLDQQRRYLDPLLDRNFVQRLTGELDDDLMHRATALQKPTHCGCYGKRWIARRRCASPTIGGPSVRVATRRSARAGDRLRG